MPHRPPMPLQRKMEKDREAPEFSHQHSQSELLEPARERQTGPQENNMTVFLEKYG